MYKLFIVGVLLAGCGAGFESSTNTQSDALASCPADKVLVCHFGDGELIELCVAPNAVQSHLDQGDLEGPCETVGVPPSIPPPLPPEWMPQVPTQPQQLAEPSELTPDHPRSATIVAPPAWTPQQPTQPAELAPSWTPEAPKQPQQLAEESSTDAPDWTPQPSTPPAQICAAEGDACGQDFGGCCTGLACSWGVCIPD